MLAGRDAIFFAARGLFVRRAVGEFACARRVACYNG